MPIESLDNLGLIEKMENLVFMLLNEKDKFAIENILLHILNLSLNNWNEKFANILYKDEVINLFKEIVASSKMKVWETILKILSSISYYSEELDYKTTNYLTSWGILDMILNFLYIPQNPKELNTDIWLNAIQLTLNLSITSMKVKDYLLENNIFKILSDLLELAISTDQPIMIELLLQTIKSIIHNQNFLQKSDFEDIFPFVSKYFNDSPESENLINSLVILSESITYLREQWVNDSLVILLLDHLKSKDKAIVGIWLEWIWKISSLENKYYIQVAINNNLMKYVSKIFTIPKNDWKAMCLLIFHNIAICFDTIFCKYNSKEIRYLKFGINLIFKT